jgi:preprotein translocase subunit Sss1
MKLFHWGLMLRYMVYGVLPLIVFFIVLERCFGPGWSGYVIVLLAAALPFIAIGWLGYQHLRHRRIAKKKRESSGEPSTHD